MARSTLTSGPSAGLPMCQKRGPSLECIFTGERKKLCCYIQDRSWYTKNVIGGQDPVPDAAAVIIGMQLSINARRAEV